MYLRELHPLGWQDRTGDVEGRVPQVEDNGGHWMIIYRHRAGEH